MKTATPSTTEASEVPTGFIPVGNPHYKDPGLAKAVAQLVFVLTAEVSLVLLLLLS